MLILFALCFSLFPYQDVTLNVIKMLSKHLKVYISSTPIYFLAGWLYLSKGN